MQQFINSSNCSEVAYSFPDKVSLSLLSKPSAPSIDLGRQTDRQTLPTFVHATDTRKIVHYLEWFVPQLEGYWMAVGLYFNRNWGISICGLRYQHNLSMDVSPIQVLKIRPKTNMHAL